MVNPTTMPKTTHRKNSKLGDSDEQGKGEMIRGKISESRRFEISKQNSEGDCKALQL